MDSTGSNVYVTGSTSSGNSSSNFPLVNPAFPNYKGNTDAFVARLCNLKKPWSKPSAKLTA